LLMRPEAGNTALQTNRPGCPGLCFLRPAPSSACAAVVRAGRGHRPRQSGLSLSLWSSADARAFC
jgi:hypothetical protein